MKQLKKERTQLKTFQAGLTKKIKYHTNQQLRADIKLDKLNNRIDKISDRIEYP